MSNVSKGDENHQEGDNRRRAIDHKLPSLGIAKNDPDAAWTTTSSDRLDEGAGRTASYLGGSTRGVDTSRLPLFGDTKLFHHVEQFADRAMRAVAVTEFFEKTAADIAEHAAWRFPGGIAP